MRVQKINSSFKKTMALASLFAAGAAIAVTGFSITPKEELAIKPGMTSTEVRALLGNPAHSLKFRSQLGRTWIYDVREYDIPNTHTNFYIDFGADKKVITTSERLESNENEF
jgi:hypothetical protein